jgi:hypothetical protein
MTTLTPSTTSTTADTIVADNVAALANIVTTPARRGRPRDPTSNMTKARSIVESYADPKANTKEIKRRFTSELVGRSGAPISYGTANTYFYLIQKEPA